MIDVLKLVACAVASMFKSRARLEAEILVLRHQLMILRRKAPPRPRLSVVDRLIFVWFYRLRPSIIDAVTIVRPETVVRWHRAGFRLYWRLKSRSCGGRPPISGELRRLIREMNVVNPLWGAPRIHGELLKLGIEVAQSTVAKYMARRRRPPSQGWKTFLRNHAAGIAAMDLLVVPTIGFRLLYAFVILHHDRRRILAVAVTSHPTAEWIARQIAEAFPWQEAPQYLLRDRDGVYGDIVRQRLAAMGIRDRPIAARSPWQNGYVERLIGSIRRECLDHVIVFGEGHLRRILKLYADYHNRVRTHLSLDKDAPIHRAAHRTGTVEAIPILGGLHHHYVRM
jgi:transposase InsO family protein